ncbi:FAD-dependent oxidoreductase [Massilia sp.]|uniref:FAD-dependent oxidoreductase n=1 Tax=Massilia sp. TaxID=1882437 RepID=UPI0028B06729|nr:FAD-dependent oxidoreductase [Massilia sp.]
MDTSSLWQGTAAKSACLPTLQTDLQVDVAIVGGGIAGLTAAMLLVEAGKRVAVFEARKLGACSTGNSTGNLYPTVDVNLQAIAAEHGPGATAAVAASRGAAIDLVARTVERLGLDCAFERVGWHLIAADAAHEQLVRDEHAAATAAGLEASLLDGAPLPVPGVRTLRVEGAAQFQPLAYVRQLAQAIGSEDCLIFENTEVLAVDDEPPLVHTAHARVHCKQVILATHTPAGIHLVQSSMDVVREYGVAAPLHGEPPAPGVYWRIGAERHSIRTFTAHGRDYLVVVGAAHRLGKTVVGGERFDLLERFARAHFTLGPVEYRWSAQRYRMPDKLPCIGRNIDAKNTYIATGFSGDGLTYGTLAAMLLADDILGRENPWRDLYRVGRIDRGQRPEGFEQASTRAPSPAPLRLDGAAARAQLDGVKPGESRQLELQGQPVAVYRSPEGALHVVSGKCTHMGCALKWNGAETSWDCECHGSRFDCAGKVLEGPALAPLPRLDTGAPAGGSEEPDPNAGDEE